MKRLLFVYNPHAGKGLVTAKVGAILDIFVKEGYMPTVYPTQGRNEAYKMIATFKEDYDLVVCSGGDGTLDEAVTGMLERKNKVPLGYIPAGSTNDFASSLEIPKDMIHAARNAVSGKAFACDVGKLNNNPFIYIAAFGLFTDVSYATSQSVKNVLGHTAYIIEGMKRIAKIPSYSMKITVDDTLIEDVFLYGMVTNSRSVGGFKGIVKETVIFDDGVFEVMLIRRPKNVIEFQEILGALLTDKINTKHMYKLKGKKITVECDQEVPWTVDGEFGGNHAVAVVENIKRAVEIMVDKNYNQEVEKLITDNEELNELLEKKLFSGELTDDSMKMIEEIIRCELDEK